MAGRRSAPVWLHGERIGQITSTPRRGSALRFTYDEGVLDRYPLNVPLLSASLPTGARTTDARAFFAGLLPEGDHRRSLASRAGVLDTDVFALLLAYGQDVAGAVVVGDAVAERPRAAANPYLGTALDDDVTSLADKARPLAVYDDSELSIAGLQDKMLLVALENGGWARPVHGYPSTHILKVDDRAHRGLVVAEHACLMIARAAHLPAAESQLVTLGELDTLIVNRFDREPVTGALPNRIHQEDSCQALGIDLEPSAGRAKYERHGGPRLRQVAALLDAWGNQASRYELLDQVVFTVLIGNGDAHGKNISFLHPTADQIVLAPLYDTVPTALWPALRSWAAMSVGGATELPQIDIADIVREAATWGVTERSSRARTIATAERVREACATVDLPDDPIAQAAAQLVGNNCEKLLAASAD